MNGRINSSNFFCIIHFRHSLFRCCYASRIIRYFSSLSIYCRCLSLIKHLYSQPRLYLPLFWHLLVSWVCYITFAPYLHSHCTLDNVWERTRNVARFDAEEMRKREPFSWKRKQDQTVLLTRKKLQHSIEWTFMCRSAQNRNCKNAELSNSLAKLQPFQHCFFQNYFGRKLPS